VPGLGDDAAAVAVRGVGGAAGGVPGDGEPAAGLIGVVGGDDAGGGSASTGGGEQAAKGGVLRLGSTADPALKTQTVNFLTNLDTTGGNSGSPVLNAKGELIGLNFDSNWESVSASWWFDPRYKRAVHVDMRYLRWLLAKVYPAPELLKEMGVPAQ